MSNSKGQRKELYHVTKACRGKRQRKYVSSPSGIQIGALGLNIERICDRSKRYV
jgi:hypothetical protein